MLVIIFSTVKAQTVNLQARNAAAMANGSRGYMQHPNFGHSRP